MMSTDTQSKMTSPEAGSTQIELAAKEWRQIAIANNIAPTEVDRYLLEREDVPLDVKEFIKRHLESVAAAEAGRGTVGGENVVPAHSSESGITGTAKSSTSETVVHGEVGVLNSMSEINRIKKETADAIAREGEDPGREQGADGREQLPAVEPEPSALVQAQTAESKEQTSTSGLHDTAAGVTARAAMGISGYKPSQTVANSAEDIAEKGPVSDSKTWQAMLLLRFQELWGSFKGIFS